MIVIKSDDIPNQRIVKVLGKVKVRDFRALGEDGSVQRMIKKAKAMGADALINYTYQFSILLEIPTYTGLAVKTEFIIPMKQLLSSTVCWKCGTPIEKNQRHCRECFANLT